MEKKSLLLFLIFLIAGCTDYYSAEDEVLSVNDYFGKNISVYSERIISHYIDCINGSCPAESFDSEIKTRDCWFCDSEYIGIKGDYFKVSMGVMGGADSFAGCTTQNTLNEISEEFKILEKTNDKIVVNIKKTGNFKQLGSCNNFEYDYILTYQWVFEKEK